MSSNDDIKKEWYVVNTYAGQERRVKENLERRIETMGLQDALFQIIVAEETVTEKDKKGKTVEKANNLFSGYILVQMKMTDEAWYKVRNTPGVTGFIGSSGKGAKPFPISQEEVDNVLKRLGMKRNEDVTFVPRVGQKVEILSGPLQGQEGNVLSVDEEAKTASVNIKMMGRDIPNEYAFSDIKEID